MADRRRLDLFLNVAHTLDHLLLLIFPTVVLAIADEWNRPYSELLPLATGAFFAFGAGSLPSGWLADHWSRPGMIKVFFFGIGTATVLSGFASGPVSLAIGLTLIGVIASIYHPVGIAMLVSGKKNIGETLGVWEVDVAGADLRQRSAVTLPAPAMYAWPDSQRRHLYMTCSDGGPGRPGSRHFATAWKIGAGGDLTAHGEPVALPARPIHASLDRAGRHLLTCYNWPSSFTVHRIGADGRIGAEVAQARAQFGIYAHQILTMPGDRGALLVCRGNEPTADKAEDPGSLHSFAYADGRLAHRQTIAPPGRYGFRPRPLDFHPSAPRRGPVPAFPNRLSGHRIPVSPAGGIV